MVEFRRAEEKDAARLAAEAERMFRDTYGAVNTAENMNKYCASNYSRTIQAQEILDPAVTYLVCEQAGAWSGFVQLRRGPGPAGVSAGRPVEIQRFYVDREWHGRGVAPRLMAEVFRLAQTEGADQVWLGVWEHNLRARAFYRKAGFTEAGEHSFMLGEDRQRDIVMTRPVAPGASPSG